jgi:hypothetical protein
METNSEDKVPEDIDTDKASNSGNQKSDLGPGSERITMNPGTSPGDIQHVPVYPTSLSAILEEILTHSLGCNTQPKSVAVNPL